MQLEMQLQLQLCRRCNPQIGRICNWRHLSCPWRAEDDDGRPRQLG